MNRAVALVLLALCPLALAQATSKGAHSAAKYAAPNFSWEKFLAPPSEWNSYSAKIVPKSQVSITFRMTTSWIPGHDHKGALRYKVTATPDLFAAMKTPASYPEVATPERVDSFVKRLGDYRMEIVFYDKDGFVDRKVPLNFGFGVDGDGHITSLFANDAVDMAMDEYKSLLLQGSYSINWLDSP